VASWLRLMSIRATHLHCNVDIGQPVRLGPGFRLYIPDDGSFVVESGVDFRSNFRCDIDGNGRVEIGSGTVFTSNTLIQCSTLVSIGKRCGFGQSTLIVDGNHRYQDHERHWADQGYDFRPIHIGDGAGISDNCTIRADVGERAMVASGSVVNRPIPPYCLAVGAPARVVRYFGPPDRKVEVLSAPRRRRRGGSGLATREQQP
jgi:acetyltransferase-like isoleucine patch superfamily enzyme